MKRGDERMTKLSIKKSIAIVLSLVMVILGIPFSSMADATIPATISDADKAAVQYIANTLGQFNQSELFNPNTTSDLDSTGENYAVKFNAALGGDYSYKIRRSNWYKGEYIIYYMPGNIKAMSQNDSIDYLIRYNTWSGEYIVATGKVGTNASAGNTISRITEGNKISTISYIENGDGVSNLPQSQAFYTGSTANINSLIPARSGYNFKGWNTAADGSGDYYSADFKIYSDVTLYAQWQSRTADATLTAEGYTGTYDGNAHSVSATLEGSDSADFRIEYSVDGGAWTETATSTTDAVNKTVEVRAVSNSGDFDTVVTDAVTLKVNQKDASISIDSAFKTVGANDPVLTGTIEGLVNNDDLGEVTYSRAEGETLGDYAITANYTENSNYALTVNEGTFTISPTASPLVPNNGGATPAATATTQTATAPATAAVAQTTLTEAAAPLAGETEQTLTKGQSAKAGLESWSLINLICAAFAVLMVALLGANKKKRTANAGKRFKIGIIAEIIVAIVSVVTLVLTQNMSLTMGYADKWTPLMVVLLAASIISYIAVGKRDENASDEVETAIV